MQWDAATNTVTHINNEALDPGKTYKIGCMYLSLSGMPLQPPSTLTPKLSRCNLERI